MDGVLSWVGVVAAIVGLVATAVVPGLWRRAHKTTTVDRSDGSAMDVGPAHVEPGSSLVIIRNDGGGSSAPLWTSLVPVVVALVGGVFAIVPNLKHERDCAAYFTTLIELDRAVPDGEEAGLAEQLDLPDESCADPQVVIEKVTDTTAP